MTNFSRPPKLCARCRFFRRAPRSRSFSNRLTPRLPISTGSNTRSNLPMSRVIGRSDSMLKFSRALFLRWLEETAVTFRRRPLSRRRSSVCARAIAHGRARAKSGMVALDSCRLERRGVAAASRRGVCARRKRFVPSIAACNSSTSAPRAREARARATRVCAKTIRSISGQVEQRAIALRQFDALLESAS